MFKGTRGRGADDGRGWRLDNNEKVYGEGKKSMSNGRKEKRSGRCLEEKESWWGMPCWNTATAEFDRESRIKYN